MNQTYPLTDQQQRGIQNHKELKKKKKKFHNTTEKEFLGKENISDSSAPQKLKQ